MPIAIHATIASTPTTVETTRLAFLLYTIIPNTIAIRMNRIEIIAVDAFAELATLSSAPDSSYSSLECICNDGSKCSDYQDQGQVGEGQEQLLRTRPDTLSDNLTD